MRDTVEGEKVVQSTLVALLVASGGPYFVKHERAAGGGFYDIALEPQLSRWPEIAHAALIEMKYVKAGAPAPIAEQLAQIRADAIVLLDKYSADPALIAEWRLNEKCKVKSVKLEGDSTLHSTFYTLHSSVALHRLVLVFHGGTCVLAEEV